MSVLSFEKPAKLRSSSEHADKYQSDSGVPGTYVPNMSDEDKRRWKGKVCGGSDPRVEIRKTFEGPGTYAQCLVVVRKGGVVMSLNGKATMSDKDFSDLSIAVKEAKAALPK